MASSESASECGCAERLGGAQISSSCLETKKRSRTSIGSVSPVTRVMDVTCQPPLCPPLNVVNMALSNPGSGEGASAAVEVIPSVIPGQPARAEPGIHRSAMWMHGIPGSMLRIRPDRGGCG